MSEIGPRPRRNFLPSFSRQRLAVAGATLCAILLGTVVLSGCGGGESDPRAWKQEFAAQVREGIEATKRVGEAVRLATGPLDIQRPYEIYGEEMAVAKERLEALEPAPTDCAAAEEHALAVVGPLGGTGATFNQKNYTTVLLKNAKRRPAEHIQELERDLSEAHC